MYLEKGFEMADLHVGAKRIERFRELMAQRGYDAVVLRHNPDLRWLTDAERTFDFEQAHTAFITQNNLFLHTDSRYYGTFLERLGSDSPWKIDQDSSAPTEWVASHIADARARVVAVEDTVDLAFFDNLEQALGDRSVAALLPRMHGDIAELRIVKD